jgi:23S rRNA pseudouridine2604 synthase
MAAVLRLRTILLRYFKLSNAEVLKMVGEGRVRVDGKVCGPATKLEEWEEVTVDGKVIRPAKQFSYIRFHKPRGVESTTNESIAGNLFTAFHFPVPLFPVGRLDKDSEGLLIMTDDGRVFRNIAFSDREKEKEYFVTTDKAIDAFFLQRMSEGIVIMGQKTRPAKLFAVDGDPFSFRIILTQGLNRQIRRMCYKLGYNVTRLVRTRIVNVELGYLAPGEWVPLTKEELENLR